LSASDASWSASLTAGISARGVEQAVVVNHAQFAAGDDGDAGFIELARVGFALVAQDVELGGLDQRRRQAGELFFCRPQRRGGDFRALFGVPGVIIPHPDHHRPCQEVALLELPVAGRLEVRVRHRPEQHLQAQLRPALGLGLERDGGRQVPADAVADDRQPLAIDLNLRAMLGDPLRRRVAFIERDGILRLGRAGILDEDRHRPRVRDKVAHEALMRGEVTQHPAAAVKEHEPRQRPFDARRPHDVEQDRKAACLNPLFADLGVGLGCCHVGLRAFEHLACVRRRHRLQRRAIAAIKLPEKAGGAQFHTVQIDPGGLSMRRGGEQGRGRQSGDAGGAWGISLARKTIATTLAKLREIVKGNQPTFCTGTTPNRNSCSTVPSA
jgi:hypothetical protein